ncbi:MAG: TlyA family RNA methyltransferase, partial [Sedimentibacter sp.]
VVLFFFEEYLCKEMKGYLMEECRLDVYLNNKGFAESRERGKQLITNNCVFVNDKLKTKPSFMVNENDNIIVTKDLCYVSKGFVKLEKAISVFSINTENVVAVDIGASTGGFTDFLLKNGAKKVYAVDVGHGQLHETLKNNNCVINMENMNFRYADTSVFTDLVDIVTVDVSFISVRLILPKIVEISHENTNIIVLVKPQFEAGKGNVGKNGIVKDKKIHLAVLNNFNEYSKENGLTIKSITYSPIKGGNGNIEYLAYLGKANIYHNEINFKNLIDEAFEKL